MLPTWVDSCRVVDGVTLKMDKCTVAGINVMRLRDIQARLVVLPSDWVANVLAGNSNQLQVRRLDHLC
jgi:hypothetical protein